MFRMVFLRFPRVFPLVSEGFQRFSQGFPTVKPLSGLVVGLHGVATAGLHPTSSTGPRSREALLGGSGAPGGVPRLLRRGARRRGPTGQFPHATVSFVMF